MTGPLSVCAAGDVGAAGDVAQVVASLPVSLRWAGRGAGGEAGAADLVAVAGAPGWEQEAQDAVASGARGLLVIDPTAADLTPLRQAVRAAGVPVVVDATWNHDPAVAASASVFAEHADPEALLEARTDAPLGVDLDGVLLAQLALVRAAVSPVTGLELVRWGPRGYDALADLASGSRAALTALCSGALEHRASLRIVRPSSAVALRLSAPSLARPGEVVVSGAEGATLLPTRWETGHRSAWRHLHHLVTTGSASDELEGLADDVRVARGAS